MDELKETKPKTETKKIKTISVNEKIYNQFGKEMKERGYSISEVLVEFMKRVLDIIKSGGGEVVFGIEGKNWKQGDKPEVIDSTHKKKENEK